MAPDEGYIKFRCVLQDGPPPSIASLAELNKVRTHLWDIGWIGEYPDGTAFGNVSVRTKGSAFIISGTQTGFIRVLEPEHYSLVKDCDIAGNRVVCTGRIRASSESMTHAAVYLASPTVASVLHIHHPQLWKDWQHKVPTTSSLVQYGTPAMAREVSEIVAQNPIEGLIIMAGHRDGLLAYAQIPGRAFQLLSQLASQSR
jgi:L-ribulose-5-phosphate 4-epimerase